MKIAQRPSPVRQSYNLPGAHVAEFTFTRPDLLGIEITPSPEFEDRADALAFLAAYVAARREFLTIVATLTGMVLQVVDDLPNGASAISEAIAPENRQC